MNSTIRERNETFYSLIARRRKVLVSPKESLSRTSALSCPADPLLFVYFGGPAPRSHIQLVRLGITPIFESSLAHLLYHSSGTQTFQSR